MATDHRPANEPSPDLSPRIRRQLVSVLAVTLSSLTLVPVASAHGGTENLGLTQWHGIGLLLLGVLLVGTFVIAKRTEQIKPTSALAGILVGLAVAIFGAILFEGLSPDPTYAASSMPFPRSWYTPLSVGIGLGIAVLSFVVGCSLNHPGFLFQPPLTGDHGSVQSDEHAQQADDDNQAHRKSDEQWDLWDCHFECGPPYQLVVTREDNCSYLVGESLLPNERNIATDRCKEQPR